MQDFDVVIIGGGAAGLMAAEAALDEGARVLLAEAKPSLARKVLMAGKSGLNITKDEPLEEFLAHYQGAEIRDYVRVFSPNDVKSWANALGAEVFTGSSGKVFPKAMKASPILRAWLARLDVKGLVVKTRWRWIGKTPQDLRFATPDGEVQIEARTALYALGGGSWARLGSDGEWVEKFPSVPLRPANMGFDVNWSAHMEPYFGAWLKNISLSAGARSVLGEAGITRHGIEGGAVYALSREIADRAELRIDLLPRKSLAQIEEQYKNKKGASLSNVLRKMNLSDAARAMFFECSKNRAIGDVKSLVLPVVGPRPIDEAISTSGGVSFDAVNEDLSLKSAPHIFVVGEMLDWSAPTGGYLLTGCFATGRAAGQGAAKRALRLRKLS